MERQNTSVCLSVLRIYPAMARTVVQREPDATGEAAERRATERRVHRAIPGNRISENKPARRIFSRFLKARAVSKYPMASDRLKSDVGLLVGRLVLQLFSKITDTAGRRCGAP